MVLYSIYLQNRFLAFRVAVPNNIYKHYFNSKIQLFPITDNKCIEPFFIRSPKYKNFGPLPYFNITYSFRNNKKKYFSKRIQHDQTLFLLKLSIVVSWKTQFSKNIKLDFFFLSQSKPLYFVTKKQRGNVARSTLNLIF